MRPYKINFSKIARWLLPADLRNAGLPSLMDAMLAPLMALHLRFLAFREEVIVEVDRTSQVCRLKNTLNNAYDATLRRVEVVDGPDLNPLYIFLAAEKKPVYLHVPPVYLYTVPETYAGADFIVKMPAVPYTAENIAALIDRQRLASKKDFLIQSL